ncbi:MAG: SMP-30/gluconolactonase/LRE family protein [Dongiaceae bacterium]
MRTLIWGVGLALIAGTSLAAEPTVINGDVAFPEGPVISDGKLFYVEYGAHRVDIWDGKSNVEFWKQDGCGPSAIVPLGDGFAITCYDSGQMVQISRQGKTVAAFAKDDAGQPLVGPNDGTPDGKGGIYFTTSGPWEAGPIVGRVLHMSADGRIREVANDLHYANGIALSPDGARLFVNESEAGRVISFKVEADGSLSDRRLFVRLYQAGEAPDVYPDGLKFGPDGHLYVGEYSAGRILELDDAGKVLKVFTVPSAASPNFTFSPDGKTIYVMAVDDKSAAPYKGKVYAIPNQ